MLGLMLLLGIAVFVAIVIGAGIGAGMAAHKSGKSPDATLWWGVAASTFVLGLVFWDAIPTHIAVWYYRSQTQPLVINKSAEDWLKENKDDLPNIKYYRGSETPPRYVLEPGFELRQSNSRIAIGNRYRQLSCCLQVRAFESVMVDTKTGQVLLQMTRIVGGNSGGIAAGGEGWWKPWLISAESIVEKSAEREFSRQSNQLAELGK